MTTAPTTRPGIRLKGGAPIPPAPNLGTYSPVTAAGQHLGGVVELAPRHVIPVCVRCAAPLPARPATHLAKGALLVHWGQDHPEATT